MNKEIQVIKIKAKENKKTKKIKYTVIFDSNVTKDSNELIISEDVLVKYNIMEEKKLKKEEINKIIEADKIALMLSKTLNYLSFSMHSKKEIYQYLDQKCDETYLESDKKKIVSALISLGYIDDYNYSINLINHYKASKGKTFIINKLKQKGISEDDYKKAIEECYKAETREEEKDRIRKIIIKNKDKYRKYPLKKQRELLYIKLKNNGFSASLILEEIQKVELTDESELYLKDLINKKRKSLENKDISEIQKKRKLLIV